MFKRDDEVDSAIQFALTIFIAGVFWGSVFASFSYLNIGTSGFQKGTTVASCWLFIAAGAVVILPFSALVLALAIALPREGARIIFFCLFPPKAK